jgi:hypothetical protein
MDNLETQATLGTIHSTNNNKIKMQQKTKKMINTKNLGVNPSYQQLSSFWLNKKTSQKCGYQSLHYTFKHLKPSEV